MFYITTETCRRFTFAGVLMMATMNVKTTRTAPNRHKAAAAQRG